MSTHPAMSAPDSKKSFEPFLEQMPKVFPVGLIGAGFDPAASATHPWSAAAAGPVLRTFPCLSFIADATPAEQRRMRARCQCVLFRGTDENLLPREIVEILLDGACLVTERSALLETTGFADGVNCLFATPDDVTGKLAAVLKDSSLLTRLTNEGRALGLKLLQFH